MPQDLYTSAMAAEFVMSQEEEPNIKRRARPSITTKTKPGLKKWGKRKPRLRLECLDKPRPCPWVSCKFNLMIDVSEAGSLVFNYPSGKKGKARRRPDAISQRARTSLFDDTAETFVDHAIQRKLPSCLLDVVDQHGDITLEDVGNLMSITRERVRQIETKALMNFATNGVKMGVFESREVADRWLAKLLQQHRRMGTTLKDQK